MFTYTAISFFSLIALLAWLTAALSAVWLPAVKSIRYPWTRDAKPFKPKLYQIALLLIGPTAIIVSFMLADRIGVITWLMGVAIIYVVLWDTIRYSRLSHLSKGSQ